MKKTIRFIALGVIVLSAVTACRRSSSRSPAAVLVPLDETQAPLEIELWEFRMAVARLRLTREDSLDAKPLPPELKTYVLDRLIDEHLLLREAQRLQVRASTLTVSREMAQLRNSMPTSRFQRMLFDTYQTEKRLAETIERHLTAIAALERLTLGDIKVTDEEVRAAWDALPPTQKIQPERIHAAQILVATEDQARTVLTALRRRRNFATLARKHSISPEGAQGGDLGWFARGELPSVFDEMCFPLRKGYYSTHITASEYGYHLCKVLDRKPERSLTFDELREELTRDIHIDKARQARNRVMANLRSSVKIKKNKRAIARVQ